MKALFSSKFFWIFVILIALVLGYVFMQRRKKQNETQQTIESTLDQASGLDVNSGNFSLAGAGAAGGKGFPGVVLTGTQCRQVLRGKCGRRCVLPREKCAGRKACWEASKQSICNWPSNKDIDS